ncbi:hypothetical protein SKAU_G00196640 [Synaphobranchus kaupii]|uniref:Uncharacterized protein n=1 Tax=Synaphobranchus kaupii TaxID=118154 RepID=A0A9Q1FF09_SYNKA|nr:hypothetical protein SKAU_G00196640 [Synaphobranchus kaupii]
MCCCHHKRLLRYLLWYSTLWVSLTCLIPFQRCGLMYCCHHKRLLRYLLWYSTLWVQPDPLLSRLTSIEMRSPLEQHSHTLVLGTSTFNFCANFLAGFDGPSTLWVP